MQTDYKNVETKLFPAPRTKPRVATGSCSLRSGPRSQRPCPGGCWGPAPLRSRLALGSNNSLRASFVPSLPRRNVPPPSSPTHRDQQGPGSPRLSSAAPQGPMPPGTPRLAVPRGRPRPGTLPAAPPGPSTAGESPPTGCGLPLSPRVPAPPGHRARSRPAGTAATPRLPRPPAGASSAPGTVGELRTAASRPREGRRGPAPGAGSPRPHSPSTVFFLKSEAMAAVRPGAAGAPTAASVGSCHLLR